MDSLALAHEDDDINIVDAFIEWTSRLDPYDDEDVEFPSWYLKARTILMAADERPDEQLYLLDDSGMESFLCKAVHIYDYKTKLHRLTTMALVGPEWNIAIRHLVSPIVSCGTWSSDTKDDCPDWVYSMEEEVWWMLYPYSEIVEYFTIWGRQSDNAVMKPSILQWLSAVTDYHERHS